MGFINFLVMRAEAGYPEWLLPSAPEATQTSRGTGSHWKEGQGIILSITKFPTFTLVSVKNNGKTCYRTAAPHPSLLGGTGLSRRVTDIMADICPLLKHRVILMRGTVASHR